ncbi:uncharacterized protein TRIADDRAFT_52979 [Trichoplax adhaerens]|uniref:Uncharacterized protein n=1 Tax=Trichoplax adhaerens TaxID=10228 RepID=B3RMZ3_TRIAD|nr:predicted protein [Trichoplax adhaerens]EDV27363.1 predicted protein [Trichoplax adhaerens]|eukprot:XP_002109197.1 predicted protein [Trichoplax adhaerens]
MTTNHNLSVIPNTNPVWMESNGLPQSNFATLNQNTSARLPSIKKKIDYSKFAMMPIEKPVKKILQPLSQLSPKASINSTDHKISDDTIDDESCFTSMWEQNTIKIKEEFLAAYLIELEAEIAKLSAENDVLLNRLRHWQFYQTRMQQMK